MTDAELLAHPEFLALCLTWETQGRAPLPGADWLAERGMDGEAAAWEWAATEPDRYTPYPRNYDGREWGGIMPYRNIPTKFTWEHGDYGPYRSTAPGFGYHNKESFKTFPAAVAAFLIRSAEVYGPAGPPSSVPHEAAA